MTRDERKADYRAYREAARKAVTGQLDNADGIRVDVDSTAAVSLCEDGAFVDAFIWIPKRIMESVR